MVFVLGILTLLALVGIGLIASTRMDAKRVDNQSNITSTSDSISAIVKQLRETLRQDIWGSNNSIRPLDNSNLSGTGSNPLGIGENNEPLDVPGADAWLSHLMPYLANVPGLAYGAIPVLPSGGNLFTGNTEIAPISIPGNPNAGEIDVLIWPSVSYAGSDLLIPRTNPGGQFNEFAWLYNTRNNIAGQLVRYGPANPPAANLLPNPPDLVNVPVIQTWPPMVNPSGLPGATWAYDPATGAARPMIPGSTTNVSIRVAEEWWRTQQEAAINTLAQATIPNFKARFPYFDTNGDGIVDLYDADSDGVPDSPISFVIEGGSAAGQASSKLYAVIRVVDHGAMLNANVASSFSLFSQNLMFDESNANLQRRGRRATELLLDDVCHRADTVPFGGQSNRSWQLMNYRTRNTSWINDPFSYDMNVVRRDLIGGLTGNMGYRLFGLPDEASLRRRFTLTPMAYANFRKGINNLGSDKIDSALCWSLLWSNTLQTNGVYEQDKSRWSRMNADFEPYGLATHYEGWDVGTERGWRKMYTEDEPYSIRRPMFTTVSRDVMLPPVDLTLNNATGELLQLPTPALTFTWMNATSGPQVMTLNDPADPWPMAPTAPADWMKILPIDVNMTADTPATAIATQARYMKYLASAMYIALGGVNEASGLNTLGEANRLSTAWQFAANVADYRDSDGTPTIITMPTGVVNFGLEKQPFFTEGYCRVQYNDESQPDPADRDDDDDWFDAVELFIPPTWMVNTDKLYLRTPGSAVPTPTPAGIPLTSFVNAPAALDGNGLSINPAVVNTNGTYYVFCGPTGSLPPGMNVTGFFSSAMFQPDHGNPATAGKVELVYFDPADPNSMHVLDVIESRGNNTVSGHSTTGGPTLTAPAWAIRNNPVNGGSERFSLARSTKGWRFTVARYQLLDTNDDNNSPGPGPFETLGLSNSSQNQIRNGIYVDELPEMVWPSRSKRDHATGSTSEVPNGFATLAPHEAFDTVVDLSRIPMVCNQSLPGGLYDTATDALWKAIDKVNPIPAGGNETSRNKPELALAAAHIDFANTLGSSMVATNAPVYPSTTGTGPQTPWSWRLLRYLTTNSHAEDFVDNDGNDGTNVNTDQVMDGPNTLFRMAGRINVNTAPISVLRSVPFMSLLPDSIQFTELARISGNTAAQTAATSDPVAAYTANPTQFWDFASAIVAVREGRDVVIRQKNAAGNMQAVAVCDPSNTGRIGYFSIGELACVLGTGVVNYPPLNDSMSGNNLMFRTDRFVQQTTGPTLFPKPTLMGHRLTAGDVEFTPSPPTNDYRAFSPDFRYRAAAGGQPETIDFTPVGAGDVDGNTDVGGIRARDIYLSRWASVLTTRSDVFTAYIALIDEDGKYVRRAQVTFDRSNCFGEQRVGGGLPGKAVLPDILLMEEGSYSDDSR